MLSPLASKHFGNSDVERVSSAYSHDERRGEDLPIALDLHP
jgi:hypothetical protein